MSGKAGTFQKGKSGNPSGRPKIVSEIKELAQQHAPEAFKKVVGLLKSDDERVAFVAAQEILNRAYGKPTQSMEVTRKRDASDFDDTELYAIARMGRPGADQTEGSAQEPDCVH
jgi:Family of unknown function (DUF5681)